MNQLKVSCLCFCGTSAFMLSSPCCTIRISGVEGLILFVLLFPSLDCKFLLGRDWIVSVSISEVKQLFLLSLDYDAQQFCLNVTYTTTKFLNVVKYT